MENASKALLIAGAILIAIVLITFGVVILGQGSEIINDTSLSEAEISTFNSKFTQFEGKNVRGSKVNSLLNTVIQHNLAQDDDGKKVTVNTEEKANAIGLSKTSKSVETKADTGKIYEVKCNYNGTTGLINDIVVTAK